MYLRNTFYFFNPQVYIFFFSATEEGNLRSEKFDSVTCSCRENFSFSWLMWCRSWRVIWRLSLSVPLSQRESHYYLIEHLLLFPSESVAVAFDSSLWNRNLPWIQHSEMCCQMYYQVYYLYLIPELMPLVAELVGGVFEGDLLPHPVRAHVFKVIHN